MTDPTPSSPSSSQDIRLDRIAVTDRLRDTDPAWVEVLAATMAERGLDQPILVRPVAGGRYALVAGAHRHAAAVKLGWATIRCEVKDLDDLSARLAEIDENLIRRELSALDRALFLAERKRVYEQRHPAVKHGGKRRKGSSGQDGHLNVPRFSKEVEEKTGLSERVVRRATRLATLLDAAAIAALRASPLADNEAQLFAFAALPEADRRAVIKVLGAEGATTIAAALEAIGKGAPQLSEGERLYRAIVGAWARADARTRKRVLAAITAPAKAGDAS